jgi:hypothetical protein
MYRRAMKKVKKPNKPDPANPAMASRFHAGHQWRGVADPGRYAAMHPSIRQAKPPDADKVADILREAARWLEQGSLSMWRDDELLPSRIAADVAAGLFFVAEYDGEAAGTVKFQLEDALFWPDVPQAQSAFVHRLAVRRRFAGGNISSALRGVYERFGFHHHSDRQVGPYFVSRYEYDVMLSAA